MPDPKALDAIFERHDHQYASRAEWLQAIQADLLRWATPDRTHTRAVLAREWILFMQAVDLPECYEEVVRFTDHLVTALCGPEPTPIWCEHFGYSEARGFFYLYSLSGGDGGWIRAWDICPIKGCHKPRPTEG